MKLLKSILIKNIDRNLGINFYNISKYEPTFPSKSDFSSSILDCIINTIGGLIALVLISLILELIIPISTSLLISAIFMSTIFSLFFISKIIMTEVPSKITQSTTVTTRSGQKFTKTYNTPDYNKMIKYNNKQILINLITAIIKYIPSIISFWIIKDYLLLAIK